MSEQEIDSNYEQHCIVSITACVQMTSSFTDVN